jgi:hypothetical protein
LDLRKGRKYQTAEENCTVRCFIAWAFQVIKVIKRSTRQDGHVARKERRYMLTDFRTGKPMEDAWKTWIEMEKLKRMLEKNGENMSTGFD